MSNVNMSVWRAIKYFLDKGFPNEENCADKSFSNLFAERKTKEGKVPAISQYTFYALIK